MKKIIAKWLTGISKISAELAKRLVIKTEPILKPKRFASLTPTPDIPDGDANQYFEALKWALQSNEIKNIALTGPYGSGKSSILLSFQKKFPEHKFLNISLATFGNAGPNQDNGNDGKNGDPVPDHKQIEQSILQQIFYKKTQKSIPDSRFTRRSALTKMRLSWYTFCVAVWLLSICRLMNIGFSRQPEVFDNALRGFESWLDLISYAVVLFGMGKLLFELIRIARNLTLQKIKFSASSIEVEAEKGKSPLNENFDELLYFFEATKYHGLIIEDLDRFQSTDIFSKLRELNLLLNSSEQIKNKPVVFVYGIKDDLFVVGDRTKFFDFIIPVVPVVSSSNAGDRLYQMLSEAEVATNLPQAHVFRIGSYVTDMRMVRNIFNEYIMYRDKIGIEAEDKLLGIIAYKNIYPKDFSDLHSGTGIIHRTFAGKEHAVAQISGELTSEIERIEGDIKKFEGEIAQNILELNTIYLSKIIERLPATTRSFHVNGSHMPLSDVIQEANFNNFRSANNIHYINSGQTYNAGFKFSGIEAEVDPVKTYADRYKTIKEKENIDLANLRSDLARKQVRKEQLSALSLRELLITYDVTRFGEDLNKYDLLVYLLRYGAIDEQYQLYISNFYEGVLKKNDQLFLVAVKNRQAKALDLQLSNCAEIMKRLQVDDFRNHAVLNIHLIGHLLEQKDKHRIFLRPILDQLIDGTEQSWNFLEFCRTKTVDKGEAFINFICSSWPDFWLRALSRFKDRDQDLLEIFTTIINTCSQETLAALNKDRTIDHFLQDEYFDISRAVTEDGKNKVQSLIQSSGLTVRRLVDPAMASTLQFLIKGNHYELTKENIFFILSRLSSQGFQVAQDNSFTFSDIMQSGCPELIEYFYKDINYSVELLLDSPHNREEEPAEVLKLLNDVNLTHESKKRFIESIHFSLPEVSAVNIETDGEEISKDLIQDLLKYHRLNISWQNVSHYFDRFELDAPLIAYLDSERNYSELSKRSVYYNGADDEVLQALAQEIYKSEGISDLAFAKLRLSLPQIQSGMMVNVPKRRLLYLITEGIIPFTQTNLDALTEIGDMVNHFLQTNLSVVGLDDDQIKYQPQHIRFILEQHEVSESKALHVIDSIAPNELTAASDLAGTIADLIIDRRLRTVKPTVIEAIFDSAFPEDKKVELFIELTQTLPYQELFVNLSKLGSAYQQLSQGATEFEEGEIDTSILKYLKRNKFISGHQVIEGRIEITKGD